MVVVVLLNILVVSRDEALKRRAKEPKDFAPPKWLFGLKALNILGVDRASNDHLNF